MERLGPYELLDVVGQGGMGRVWRARDTRYERIVALKVIAEDKTDACDLLRLFHREAELVGRLNSPHIIPIHNYGEIDQQAYLDMRFVPGQPLSRLVRSRGPADVPTALSIIRQVASAIDDAHAAGVVHRDVKPANILVSDKGFVYLADFGIAVVEGRTAPEGEQILGSWGYMAPERFECVPQEAPCDVYALACVLHFALTGAPPFPGHELDELREAHRHAKPPALSGRVPGVSPQMDAVIAKALAKDPKARPRSASEWVDRLERAQGQRSPARATAPAATRRAGRSAASSPAKGQRGVRQQTTDRSPSPSRSRGWSPAIVALLVVLAVIAGALAALGASG